MEAKDTRHNELKLVKLGIDARNEYMVFMRKDCPVCLSEGFEALNRIRVSKAKRKIMASLIVWDNEEQLTHDQMGLSEAAIEVYKVAQLLIQQLEKLNLKYPN